MTAQRGITVRDLACREMRARWQQVAMAVIAVAIGAGAVVASLASLTAYDRRTEAVLQRYQQETAQGLAEYDRKLQVAMGHLGFNVTILPQDQNLADFYADDYAAETMTEGYASRLASSGVVTIGYWVPVLRQKTNWQERRWTILVIGYGRMHTGESADQPPPAVPSIPEGHVDVGWELHRAFNLEPGQDLKVNGSVLRLRRCLPETGSTQDVALIMALPDAQKLLGTGNRINEIRALQCRTAWNQLDRVQADIQRILPGVKVVQKQSETVTVAAARQAFEQGQRKVMNNVRASRAAQRQRRFAVAGALCALALILALGTAGVLSWINTAARQIEIALWHALGCPQRRIQTLFLYRALTVALLGGILGWTAGAFWWGWPGMRHAMLWAAAALASALLAMLPAGLITVAWTARTSPADVLKNEV